MVTIRSEQPGDIEGIHTILEAAFPTDAEARLVDALRNSQGLVISLVAENESELVGHIAFSVVTVGGVAVGLGLAPLAVRPEYHRQGIGAQLVKFGLEEVRATDHGLVVVLGDPAYYSRFGFIPASRFGLTDQFKGGPAFQVMELEAGAGSMGSGLVEYAPEFALVTP